MSDRDAYTFVRGIAITQQQAFKILDDSDYNYLLDLKREHGFTDLTFEQIFDLRKLDDYNAGDFFASLFTVPITGSIELYTDEMRRGIDDGPVILGVKLAEVSDGAKFVEASNDIDAPTQQSLTTSPSRYKYDYDEQQYQFKQLATKYGFLPYIKVYVINTS